MGSTKESDKPEEKNSSSNASSNATVPAELKKAEPTPAGLTQVKSKAEPVKAAAPAEKVEAKKTESPAPVAATASAKDMEKKLDAAPVVEEPRKSKSDLKKEAIARGDNTASNAVPVADLKGDKVLDPKKIEKLDDRATKPFCSGLNGHAGVDC